MSEKIIPNVSCLACNSKFEVSCTKNIFKTTIAGESLAPFVSTTLVLAGSKLRTSYLCLPCLDLFVKLEEAQRKANHIKSKILNIFQNSFKKNKNVFKIANDFEITPNTKNSAQSIESQVTITKPKVITKFVQIKSTRHVSDDVEKQVTDNCVQPINQETEKNNEIYSEDDGSYIDLTNFEPFEEFLVNASTFNESSNENIVNPNADSDTHSNNAKVINYTASLEDHQYGQLPPPSQPCNRQKLSTLQAKAMNIVKSTTKSKKLKVPKPELYTCPNCGKKTRTLKNLQEHYKTHSNFRPYMCEKCGLAYKSKRTLSLHISSTHEKSDKHVCQICNQNFCQKFSLKRHLAIHTGEKRYECKICSKRFTHYSSYSMHKLWHSQTKDFQCELCTTSFLSTSHLKRHMRRHTGEKLHKCDICGKSFAERYNLVSHKKIHDPVHCSLKEAKRKTKKVINRRCERCNINFSTQRDYNVHLHIHTPGNSVTYLDEDLPENGIFLNLNVDEFWDNLSTD